MAGALGSLVVDLAANTTTLRSDFESAKSVVDRAVADINVSIGRIGSGQLTGLQSQVKSLTADFERMNRVIAGVFGVGIGLGMAREVSALADEYQNVSNRIRTTVDDAKQLVIVQNEVFDIAQKTSASLDDTAKMYQRLEQAIESSGKSRVESQQQALALTKTLNQEIVVSGASAGEASRSIMDLVHGLSGGVLHAQQLRPIMRQMPDLAKQIADGLGLSAEQFEEMVHKGLPAADVLRALEVQAGKIDERFNSLPLTFGRAWQQLTNAIERYVGEATQASASSELIKSGLVGIANNIDDVATAVELAGAAMGLWLGSKSLQLISGLALSLRDAVLAQGEYATAAITAAQADITAATVKRDALQVTIAQADARNDLRVTEMAQLERTIAALNAEVVALERETVASTNVLAAHERLIAARAELAAASARVAEVETAMAASQAKAALAEQAETAATAELTLAKQRLTAAQLEATSATGLFARAGSGLLSAIGGWPTLLLAAGVAVYYLATAQTEFEEQANRVEKITKDLANSYGILTPAQKQSAQAALEEAQIMARLAKAKADAAADEAEAARTSNASTTEYVQAADAADHYAKVAVDLADKASKLAGMLRFVNVEAGVNSTAFANWMDGVRGALTKIEALGPALEKTTEQLKEQAATYHKGKAAVLEYQRDQMLAKLSVGATAEQVEHLRKKLEEQYAPAIEAAKSLDAITQSAKASKKEVTAKSSALEELNRHLSSLSNLEEQLSSGLGGPYLTALRQYQKGIDLTAKAWAEAVVAGKADQALIDRLSDDQEQLELQLERTNKQIKDQNDLFSAQAQDLSDLRSVQGLSAQQQEVMLGALRKFHDLQRSHYDFFGNYIADEKALEEALRNQLPQYVANERAIKEITESQKKAQEVAREYASIWVSAGDSIAGAIADVVTKGGSLFRSLADIARDVVNSIIEYFAKLAVINPILNSLFGGSMTSGGGSLLPTLASLGGSMLGGGSGGTLSNGILNFATNGNGGTLNSIMNPSSWLGAGQKMWSGFSSGLSSFWNGSQGAVVRIGGGGVNLPATSYNGAYGGYSSPLGQGLGVAAGIYAGYNRYQDRYNTGSGLAGAAAYGMGTYAVGAGLASAAASTGFAAGMTGAFAIPVVGWIAAAAMLVDMISGGGLFGTSANKFQQGRSDLVVGSDGASLSVGADYKGKKPLFGGSYHEWKTFDATKEQIEAANAFYSAILESSSSFARQFGLTVGEVASGTFRQTFDKNGKVTGSSSIVNGVEYKDEDQKQFAMRLTAESYILDLRAIGVEVAAYTAKFVQDAEAYANAVQDAATAIGRARQDIKDGIDISGGKGLQSAFDTTLKFKDGSDSLTQTYQRLSFEAADLKAGVLLLTGQDTIESIEAFLRESQRFGESLAQTYQRLQEASQSYNQLVAQFKPGATYVDDFEAAISGVNDQMLAYMEQANAYAKAAGLQGAATEDLVNIQKWAIEQQNQLFKQLQASAQSLAFSLGLTTVGSLDDVNAEIARLEAKAGRGASAVESFGSAMETAAQRATAAMDLLLGNLSPLNDREKLQRALDGLRAGTVTQEQVLQIGRRLYASSQAYNDLFAQVQQYGPSGSVGARSGGNALMGGSDGSGAGLTAAEKQRLDDLLKQRDELQNSAQLAKYQTLAQQIAEIAAFKGEDWQDVLKSMKVDIQAFEKGLGMTDAQTRDYIRQIMESKDSNKQNTGSIVQAIKELGDRLLGESHASRDGREQNLPEYNHSGDRGYRGGDRGRRDDQTDRLIRSIDRLTTIPSRNLRPRVETMR